MKKTIYYLQSISIALGALVILRSIYCLIKTFMHYTNPFTAEFWDYYLNVFQYNGLSFRLFWLIGIVASLILLIFIRKKG
jgi:hypothetical protein